MRKVILALAALFTLGCATHAWAAAEMPMFYATGGETGKGNLTVAHLIEESLAKDRSGNAYIQGTPCLTPTILLKTIHEYQPDVQVEKVGDLPGLYRSLIAHKARAEGLTEPVEMSRMFCSKPGSLQVGDHFDPHGFFREFRTDEYAYFLPNHTDAFSAGECTNIPRAKKAIPPPPPAPPPVIQTHCIELDIDISQIPAGATNVLVRNEYVGPYKLNPMGCYFKGKKDLCEECNIFESAEHDLVEDAEVKHHIHLVTNFREVRTFEMPVVHGRTIVNHLSPDAMDKFAATSCIEFDYGGRHYKSVKGDGSGREGVVFDSKTSNTARLYLLGNYTFVDVGPSQG